jgi:hypothetical protein
MRANVCCQIFHSVFETKCCQLVYITNLDGVTHRGGRIMHEFRLWVHALTDPKLNSNRAPLKPTDAELGVVERSEIYK